MTPTLLNIQNLSVSVAEKEILSGLDLTVGAGQTHVIMGPNGAGKSTLMNAIMAHPNYTVTGGDIIYNGKSLANETADARARLGIFLSFQQAYEVAGITLENFLRASKAAVTGESQGILSFRKALYAQMDSLQMPHEYASRYLNVGFSGGEKKKSEILQLKVLNPSLALLDETDSGLDVDAVKIVSEGVKSWMNKDKAIVIITHHQRVLEALNPDFVHVLLGGKIALTGGPELVSKIAENGFQWVRERVS